GKNALVNGTSYAVDVTEAAAEAPAEPKAGGGVGQPLATQLPGLVLRVEKAPGTHVKTGDVILVIESMKMENAIVTPVDGTVADVQVKQGDQVQAGQVLAMIK
ncbi:MAG TPA: acetyl-CoA carboxylase biotin carboxyl carrier protein subunit, partial [Candidatus Paceibacterota bacterium]|nr:acetyl-CoA carboxylase biotin carboxyl carrier protein subunit [Candidatus Paceibacterota bacterium]